MASLTTAAADLEERIRRHSEAFTQLLNLIPAKNYFSVGDGSTQWNKRKQTKEESQRAKKAKLDPDAIITTSDFGRQHLGLEAATSLLKDDAITILEVREGNSSAAEEAEEQLTKRQKKQQRKDAKAAAKAAAAQTPKPAAAKGGNKQKLSPASAAKEAPDAADSDDPDGDAEEIHLSGFTFSTDLTASPPPPPHTASPTSSAAAAAPSTPKPPAATSISPEKRLEQKARLEARIQQLRAQRNADSPDGTPARNRNELMAARRKEEAQARKERKKEMRMKKQGKAVVGGGEVVVGTPVPGTPVRGTPMPGFATPAAVIALGPAAVTSASGPGALALAGGEKEKVKVKEKAKENEKLKKKKAGLKKSRPGFEGSIKAGKGGSGKKGRK